MPINITLQEEQDLSDYKKQLVFNVPVLIFNAHQENQLNNAILNCQPQSTFLHDHNI